MVWRPSSPRTCGPASIRPRPASRPAGLARSRDPGSRFRWGRQHCLRGGRAASESKTPPTTAEHRLRTGTASSHAPRHDRPECGLLMCALFCGTFNGACEWADRQLWVAPKRPDGEPWAFLFRFCEAAARDLTPGQFLPLPSGRFGPSHLTEARRIGQTSRLRQDACGQPWHDAPPVLPDWFGGHLSDCDPSWASCVRLRVFCHPASAAQSGPAMDRFRASKSRPDRRLDTRKEIHGPHHAWLG